jgi:hypothetical protein
MLRSVLGQGLGVSRGQGKGCRQPALAGGSAAARGPRAAPPRRLGGSRGAPPPPLPLPPSPAPQRTPHVLIFWRPDMGRYSAFLTAIAPPNLPARNDVKMQLLPDLSNHMAMAGPFRNWQVRARRRAGPAGRGRRGHACCGTARARRRAPHLCIAPRRTVRAAPRPPRPPRPQTDVKDEDPMRTLMCYWPQPVSIVQALTIHRAWAKAGGRNGKDVYDVVAPTNQMQVRPHAGFLFARRRAHRACCAGLPRQHCRWLAAHAPP